MKWRELWKLVRMRIPWCQLIHWLVWRVAVREAQTLDAGDSYKKDWERVASDLQGGNGKQACEYVAEELRRCIRNGTLPKNARWD